MTAPQFASERDACPALATLYLGVEHAAARMFLEERGEVIEDVHFGPFSLVFAARTAVRCFDTVSIPS